MTGIESNFYFRETTSKAVMLAWVFDDWNVILLVMIYSV